MLLAAISFPRASADAIVLVFSMLLPLLIGVVSTLLLFWPENISFIHLISSTLKVSITFSS